MSASGTRVIASSHRRIVKSCAFSNELTSCPTQPAAANDLDDTPQQLRGSFTPLRAWRDALRSAFELQLLFMSALATISAAKLRDCRIACKLRFEKTCRLRALRCKCAQSKLGIQAISTISHLLQGQCTRGARVVALSLVDLICRAKFSGLLAATFRAAADQKCRQMSCPSTTARKPS